jgi:hypothetical protein
MSPQERREIEDPNSTLHVEDYNAFMIFRLLKGAYENIEDYLCLRYGTGVIEKEQLGARGFASVVQGFCYGLAGKCWSRHLLVHGLTLGPDTGRTWIAIQWVTKVTGQFSKDE